MITARLILIERMFWGDNNGSWTYLIEVENLNIEIRPLQSYDTLLKAKAACREVCNQFNIKGTHHVRKDIPNDTPTIHTAP